MAVGTAFITSLCPQQCSSHHKFASVSMMKLAYKIKGVDKGKKIFAVSTSSKLV